jgi:ribosomal protein L3 glutamine methyltransferase
MNTVGELIERCARTLGAAGVVFGHGTDNAWDEATALVLGVSGLADDRANLEAFIGAAEVDEIEGLLKRRIDERVPLAYLLGRARFAGHQFLIEPGVVIPRSPIGELIEQQFRPWLTEPPAAILDLCTGSGCIGIAAALGFPRARVTLVDLDARACALARRNVALHELEDRVEVLEGDLFRCLPANRAFDLILCNPPYVDRADMQSLPVEFQAEPARGLDGGDDGLDVVRRVLEEGPDHLTANGMLVCEVGMSAAALMRAYPEQPLIWPELTRGGEGVFILLAG